MSELLQEGYHMPSRLKEERIQHMNECLHECLYSFQHYAAYRKIHPQHGVGEELIDKDVIDQDSFLRTRKVCGVPFYQSFNHPSSFIEFIHFNNFRGISDNTSGFNLDFFNFITLLLLQL